jgi:hypothetical protein
LSNNSPIREHELNILADKAGMNSDNNYIDNPNNSIPLYHDIKGRKGYRVALVQAAKDLFQILYDSGGVRSNQGKRLEAFWYELPEVPVLKMRPSNDELVALTHLLHSLAHMLSQPTTGINGIRRDHRYVAVPMDRNAYGKDTKRSHISATAIRKMVTCLHAHLNIDGRPNWLSFAPKHYDASTGKGKSCRIRPSDEFADWITQQGLVFYPHPNGIKPKPNKAGKAPLWVSKKDEVSTGDDAKAEPLTRELEGDEIIIPILNEKLQAQKVSIQFDSHTEYLKHWRYKEHRSRCISGGSKKVYRQFSGEDGIGGRLYGHYVQGLPSAVRKKLLIDDKPSVELDYSSIQLRLAYALADAEMPELNDFYIQPEYANHEKFIRDLHREDMKAVLTRSVGNPTRETTIQSIFKYLRDSRSKATMAKAERLYDQFWEIHSEACPHAGDNIPAAWGKLQYLDSQIALRVLSKLIDQGIFAIPVHDSFIVKAKYEDQLGIAMIEAAQEVAPGVEFKIG